MKRYAHSFALFFLTLVLLLVGHSNLAQAQAPRNVVPPAAQTVSSGAIIKIVPTIASKDAIQVGRKFILHARNSTYPLDSKVNFTWIFPDGSKDQGVEVVHSFKKPGKNTVILEISTPDTTARVAKDIFAYQHAITLLYNGDKESINYNLGPINELAESKGVYLNVIQDYSLTQFSTEDQVLPLIADRRELLQDSDVFIGGPNGIKVLSTLSKLSVKSPNSSLDFSINFENKLVVLSANTPLWLFEKIALRRVNTIAAEQLIIAEKDPYSIIHHVLLGNDSGEFIKQLPPQSYIVLKQTTKENPVFFLSSLFGLALERGMAEQTLIFLLLLPFLLTFLAFLKQILGFDSLGIFKTLVLTCAFYILGIKLGAFVLGLSVVIGFCMRLILKNSHFMYVPKTTLTLSASLLGILLMLIGGTQFDVLFGIDTSSSERAILTIFPVILIAAQADKLSLLLVYRSKKPQELIAFLTTCITVVISVLFMRSNTVETLLFAIPELIVIPFILQVCIGLYKGLRVIEIYRFRELLRHDLEE